MMNQQTTFQNNLQNMICGLFQNQASTSGTLPSNTIPNPKGEMKAITARSGVDYEGPSIPTNPSPKKVVERETEETTDKEKINFQGSTAQIPPPVIPISIQELDVPKTLPKTIPESDISKSLPKQNIPYPSRRDDQKSRDKASNQMEKIFQIFQDLRFDSSISPRCFTFECKICSYIRFLHEEGKVLMAEEIVPNPKRILRTLPGVKERKRFYLRVMNSLPSPVHLDNPLLEDIECKDSYDSNLDKSTFLVTPLSDSNMDECLTLGDEIEFLLHHDPSTPMKSIASILEGFIDDPLFEENDDLFDLGCDNDEIDAFLAIEVPTILGRNEPENEPLITFSPKSNPLHHEFTGELIIIPPRIDREHEDYINRMSLLCSNSSSRSPENSHTIIKSLPTSTTLIEDVDSNREEIDIFSGPDDSIPPGIDSDFDSEEDIIDNLLNDDPIPEYERLTFNMEPDMPVINNVDELNEDECFDPGGGEINVEVDDSFTFVTWTFLPYFTYPEVSLIYTFL
ncbi:hypothetical protein Tco_1403418 [Tanacetum coccineum]